MVATTISILVARWATIYFNHLMNPGGGGGGREYFSIGPLFYMLTPFFDMVWATWLLHFSFCIEQWASCFLHQTIEFSL